MASKYQDQKLHQLVASLKTDFGKLTKYLEARGKKLHHREQKLENDIISRKQQLEEELAAERNSFDEAAAIKKSICETHLQKMRQEIDETRDAWAAETKMMQSKYVCQSEIINLNVGGTIIKTRKSTLTRGGGFLESLVSGRHIPDLDENGNIFIDLDPTHFRLVLDFLRYGETDTLMPMELKRMFKYLCIGGQEMFRLPSIVTVYFSTRGGEYHRGIVVALPDTVKIYYHDGETKTYEGATLSKNKIIKSDGSKINLYPVDANNEDTAPCRNNGYRNANIHGTSETVEIIKCTLTDATIQFGRSQITIPYTPIS